MSALSFIFYYVRDMVGIENDGQRQFYVALVVVLAQLMGALTAYPAGKYSDKVGRKKIIYFSCVMMAMCCKKKQSDHHETLVIY